jgi:hypothetical protein
VWTVEDAEARGATATNYHGGKVRVPVASRRHNTLVADFINTIGHSETTRRRWLTATVPPTGTLHCFKALARARCVVEELAQAFPA